MSEDKTPVERPTKPRPARRTRHIVGLVVSLAAAGVLAWSTKSPTALAAVVTALMTRLDQVFTRRKP